MKNVIINIKYKYLHVVHKYFYSFFLKIKPIDADDVINGMSQEIKKHVSTPWYEKGKQTFNVKDFTPRWFYAWFCPERKLFCR